MAWPDEVNGPTQALTTAQAANPIDLSLGNPIITVSGNVTLGSLTNATPDKQYTILLKRDATVGSFSVTLPASINNTPSLGTGAANEVNSVTIRAITTSTFNVESISGWGGKIILASLVSLKLKACIPGNDASATFLDVSGNAANLVPEANNTTAFDNEGFFKTTSGTSSGLSIPQAKVSWNPYRESMILGFMLNRQAPAVNENILSLGGLMANYQGFYLSHRGGTGALRIVPILNVGSSVPGTTDSTFSYSEPRLETYSKTITLQANSTANVDAVISVPKNARIIDIMADTTVAWTATTASITVGSAAGGAQYASGADVKTITRAPTAAYTAAQLTAMDNVGTNTSIHVRVASTGATAIGTTKVTVLLAKPAGGVHVTIAYDAPTGSWYLFKNGILDPVSSNYLGFSTGANAFADVASLAELRVGGLALANNPACFSLLGYGLQFAKMSGALTPNVNLIAQRLSDSPRIPISGIELS